MAMRARRQQRPAKDDANLERQTGEEHNRMVFDGLHRLVHYEERDSKGNLERVTNVAYFLDGSSITTTYDFSTSPSSMTQVRSP